MFYLGYIIFEIWYNNETEEIKKELVELLKGNFISKDIDYINRLQSDVVFVIIIISSSINQPHIISRVSSQNYSIRIRS